MKVNNIEAVPGMVVDVAEHEEYVSERLADIAIAYGLVLDAENDPRLWRMRIREAEARGESGEFESEHISAAAEALVDSLNSATEGGWFELRDGSIWLVEDTDDYDDEDEEEYDFEE